MGRTCLAALLLVTIHSAAPARDGNTVSWGKTDVSFDQYRADAVDCAKAGYFRDISVDLPAKRFLRGFRTGHDELNKASIDGPGTDAWRDAIRRTQPDRQKRELQAIQVGDVEQCLVARGYRKFTLTGAEARQLSRYSTGSQERHRYLHRLASR